MSKTNVQKVGEYLKKARERKNHTVAEVSGAVEIDEEQLSFIEGGRALPAEEVLVTLISFLKIPDQDARDLLIASGYLEDDDEKEDIQVQQMVPAIYADEVKITKTKDGIIINFSQPGVDGTSTFRFGISETIARTMVKELISTLNVGISKQLSDGRKRTQT